MIITFKLWPWIRLSWWKEDPWIDFEKMEAQSYWSAKYKFDEWVNNESNKKERELDVRILGLHFRIHHCSLY